MHNAKEWIKAIFELNILSQSSNQIRYFRLNDAKQLNRSIIDSWSVELLPQNSISIFGIMDKGQDENYFSWIAFWHTIES